MYNAELVRIANMKTIIPCKCSHEAYLKWDTPRLKNESSPTKIMEHSYIHKFVNNDFFKC